MKKTLIHSSIAMAFGGSALLMGQAALAQSAETQKLERVVVTGSNIKRVESEGSAPVQTVSRKEIERSGVTSVNELLMNLGATNSARNDDNVSNEPGYSGTASVGLRGRTALVLLNGRRIANFASGGTFVNINSLPISAIERVEILKDGGSAIYGSDAVGGVINFITKRNFNGLEIGANAGMTSRNDRNEGSLSFAGGFGDYENDGYNVLVSGEWLHRAPLMRVDRERTSSARWSRYGLPDSLSSYAPTGNIYNSDSVFVAQYKPCPADSLNGKRCGFDVNKVLTIENGADRGNLFATGSYKLNADTRLFAEAQIAAAMDSFSANPAPGPMLITSGPYAGNTLRARFMQIGPRVDDSRFDSWRLVTGGDGTWGAYDWSVSTGVSANSTAMKSRNYMYESKFLAAFNNGTLDPTSNNNPAALVDSLRATPTRAGDSRVAFLDAKLSGSLMALPGGDLGFAVGAQIARETLTDTPNDVAQSGDVFGFVQQTSLSGKRNRQALFAEVAAPVTKSLELDGALRFDRYSDFGNAVSPRVAFRFSPTKQFLVRGAVSRSFSAPSMLNLYSNTTRGAEGVTNAAKVDVPIWNQSGGNPNLQPERGTFANLGVVLQPIKGVTASLDYYQIKKTNEIGSPSAQYVYDHNALGSSKVFNDPASGQLVVVTSLANLGQSKVKGWEFELTGEHMTAFGKVSLSTDINRVLSDIGAQVPDAPMEERSGLVTYPKLRATTTARLETGVFEWSLTSRYVGTVLDEGERSAVDASTKRLGGVNEWDLGLRYAATKKSSFNFIIKNLLDKMPPVSSYYARGDKNHFEGYAPIHNVIGRHFNASFNYRF